MSERLAQRADCLSGSHVSRSGREAEEGGGGRTLDEAARTLSALKEDVGQLKRR